MQLRQRVPWYPWPVLATGMAVPGFLCCHAVTENHCPGCGCHQVADSCVTNLC